MTDDLQEYEPLTPVGVERHLNRLRNEIPRASAALREARRVEVRARAAWRSRRRRALLADDCPKVTRDGHTVAYRDAWVDEQAAVAEWEYDVARVAREAAEDHVRGLRDESIVVNTLAKSVQQAYQMAGTGER